MNGYRKLLIFAGYVGACTFLGHEAVASGMDGMNVGLMFTGLATGAGAVVYGNIREHDAKAAVAASNGG